MPKKNSPSKDEEVQEVKEVKSASIKVLALWKSFSPDCRPYKPSTPILEFPEPLVIAIDVPLTTDLIKNAGVIAAAQLTNQAEPKTHFTPLGMRYIIDQFESAMKNGEPEQDNVHTSDPQDDDWEDDEPKKETKKSASKDDDEWDEESSNEDTKKDDNFEEDWDG